MLHVGDILSALQGWAPPVIAWERDNVGLLLGRADAPVEKALICLDVTPGVVEEAVREGAALIIAHHPVIFHPLKALRTDRTHGALLAELLRREINVIALHTNADGARFGLNHALAQALQLKETQPLDAARGYGRKLTLRVPRESAALVSSWLTGRDEIVWTSHALDENLQAIEIEIPVWRVGFVQAELTRVLGPTPHAFSEVRLEGESDGYGIGAVGNLEASLDEAAFLRMVKDALGCAMLRVSPFDGQRPIRRVAVCSGAGAAYIPAAISAGADALVTGDLTHHMFLDHQADILLVDAGHYDTERIFINLCATQLANMVFENNEKIDILQARTNTNPIWFV
ncbi:MAG: Nif3-like dinuclear metal center hexameric protein [Bacteroidota bacterium]|jgi:dinuclear metal center YbgI/SA1388 family protein